jgi:hypothetical protein
MRTEETALTITHEKSFELAQSASMAKETAEVQAAIIIAKKFPRDETEAFEKLTKSCNRLSFAEKARYKFPRGDKDVIGPSVHLAREAARLWKNIEYGFSVVRDDDSTRVIRAKAWDKESNNIVFMDDSFGKLIYRKKTGWTKPDECDLRELTNRRGAILVRNCILQLLPIDIVEESMSAVQETLSISVKKDPDTAKARIVSAFASISVTTEMLEGKLGHPVATCSPEEIISLREIWQSIADGDSKWTDYHIADDKPATRQGPSTLETMAEQASQAPTQVQEEPLVQAQASALAPIPQPSTPKPPSRPKKQMPVSDAPEPPPVQSKQPPTAPTAASTAASRQEINLRRMIVGKLSVACGGDVVAINRRLAASYAAEIMPSVPDMDNLEKFGLDALKHIYTMCCQSVSPDGR